MGTFNPELAADLIFDGQHLLSAEHARISEEIAYRYRNLRLVFIPESERVTEAEKKYPFAVVDTDSGNLIRKFSAEGPQSVRTALDWLYENDSQRVDTLAKYYNEEAAAKYAREAEQEAKFAQKKDIAKSILTSPLHTFRHNGVKITDGYRADQRAILDSED